MKKIKFIKNNRVYVCLVDDTDFIKVKDLRLHLSIFKRYPHQPRIFVHIKKTSVSLTRYLLKPPNNLMVDHINRNTLDNVFIFFIEIYTTVTRSISTIHSSVPGVLGARNKS